MIILAALLFKKSVISRKLVVVKCDKTSSRTSTRMLVVYSRCGRNYLMDRRDVVIFANFNQVSQVFIIS
jgi:hypothetical protein